VCVCIQYMCHDITGVILVISFQETHCYDLAKQLSHYLYFFFFSYWTYNYKMECGKVSQCHNGVTDGHSHSHSVSHD